MFKIIISIIFLLYATSALHIINHMQQMRAGRVNIQSDNGNYLTRCYQCGQGGGIKDNPVAVSETDPSQPGAIWNIQLVGQQIAFKGDNGKYLGRCNLCWSQGSGIYPNAIFVDSEDVNSPQVLWHAGQIEKGKWVFQGDNNKYLARCHNCLQGRPSQFVFVETDNPYSDTKAQWTLIWLD